MAIQIYNTLTRRKEEFIPTVPGKVSMYSCGPTVYNYFHIGNARSFVMSDVVRRYFEYKGFDVTYVVNLTDIDDRIIQRAIDENRDARSIADYFVEAYYQDVDALGIKRATHNPRATETVQEIIDHIAGLVANGSAYELDGDVYFRVGSFHGYGKLSGKKLDDLIAGARVDPNDRKENPADFALWKAMKPGEPWWKSPWGKGRPGWHIECSVMSRKHLGDTFDIHAGGNDLIFPHHENEIAQSEALTHVPFARYWMHFGFLNVDNEKMSKSLGNFFMTRDMLEKYHATTLRFFYLQTHYRSPINFTQEGLDAADKGLQKLTNALHQLKSLGGGTESFDVEPYRVRFEEAMDDEFNTPMALGVIFELIKDMNVAAAGGKLFSSESIEALNGFLHRTCVDLFGIARRDEATMRDSMLGDVMDVVLAVRARARQEKLWGLADFIRDEMNRIGIAIEDSKQGAVWKFTDTNG